MKHFYTLFSFLVFIAIHGISHSQILKPYFNKAEYREMLYISAKTNTPDSTLFKIPPPRHFSMIYRSEETPLDNRWDLWINDAKTIAVVSIRGTTGKAESSLENLYAAMVPAKGKLVLSKSNTFDCAGQKNNFRYFLFFYSSPFRFIYASGRGSLPLKFTKSFMASSVPPFDKISLRKRCAVFLSKTSVSLKA